MKRHSIVFGLGCVALSSLALGLSSCGGSTPSLSVKEAQAVIATWTATTHTKYSYSASLHAMGREESKEAKNSAYTDGTIAEGKHVGTSYSASPYLRYPLHITSSNFYVENADSGAIRPWEAADCVYGLIHTALIPNSDDTRLMIMAKNDLGGLTFSVRSSDKQMIFFNGYLDENLSAFARWNVDSVYDSKGYLVSEKTWTDNYNGTDTDTTIASTVTVTYA